MSDFIQQYSPVTQALIATLFTWGVTAAGAALVFVTNTVNKKVMDSMLGFGIMDLNLKITIRSANNYIQQIAKSTTAMTRQAF